MILKSHIEHPVENPENAQIDEQIAALKEKLGDAQIIITKADNNNALNARIGELLKSSTNCQSISLTLNVSYISVNSLPARKRTLYRKDWRRKYRPCSLSCSAPMSRMRASRSAARPPITGSRIRISIRRPD